MSPNISAPDRNASSVVLTGRLPTSSISLSTRGMRGSVPDVGGLPCSHGGDDAPRPCRGAPHRRSRRARDAAGGADALGAQVRALLAAHPPPLTAEGPDVVGELRATYAAQERAALAIAAGLDD